MSSTHWSTAALLATFASQAIAQDAQKIEALEKRVAELEAKKGSSGSDSMTWNDFSALGSRFQIYGFLRLDAYYDDSRPNSVTLPSFIRSEDQTAPASVRAPANNDDFTMNVKLTRIGLNFTGPKVNGLGDPQVFGKLETDFYNATATDSREALRIRVGYLQLKWTDFSLYAGQMWDVISPLQPIVNNDNVMWNAGNLGDRRPQLRGEWISEGDTHVNLQGMIGNTGAIDGQDLDPAGGTGSGFKDGDQSGVPTLQARAALITPMLDWKQNLEFGVWAHRRQGADRRSRRHVDPLQQQRLRHRPLRPRLPGRGLVQDRTLDRPQPRRRARRHPAEHQRQRQGDPAPQGGFFEVGAKTCEQMKVYAGYSFDDPNNNDLAASNVSRTSNTIWYAAIRLDYKPITLGLDYLRWETRYFGASDGTDNRLQAFVAYSF